MSAGRAASQPPSTLSSPSPEDRARLLGPGSYGEDLRRLLKKNLSRFERRDPGAERKERPEDLHRSAVVVAVTGDPRGRPCFILTRRALHLKRHAGQFALPGGKLDPGETFQQAALREMHEEVGVEATPGDVLGLLDDYPTRSGWVMRPVVVWAGCEPTLVPDPSEVADAYQVPFSELDQPGVPVLTPAPKGDHPVLSLPLAGTMVFAPTAAILYQALQVAFLGRETRVAHFEQPRFAWR